MSALRPPRRGLSRAPPALPARMSHRDRVHATTHPVPAAAACPRATHTPSGRRRRPAHGQAPEGGELSAAALTRGSRRHAAQANGAAHTSPRAVGRSSAERRGQRQQHACATGNRGLRENSFPQRCFAPTGGRRFGCCLTPPCPCPHTAPARLARASPVPLPAWQVFLETLSVLPADEPRGRTTRTSG